MAESCSFGNWGQTSEAILSRQFPLHHACRDGRVQTLSELLVDAQHSIYVEDNFYGWTPAHWAAYFGKISCLMRLHEAKMNCDTATLRLTQTPAHIAAFAGQGHCLKWLLQCGAKIDKQDYLGETPIHKAARTGTMECTSLLVSQGARLYIRNNSGATPAELAASCGFAACAKYIAAAAECQAADPQGVYGQPNHTQTMEPSPRDITQTSDRGGINGGRLPSVTVEVPGGSAAGDWDMEEEEDSQGASLQVLFNDPEALNEDVTTNHAISANAIAVAGCKRSREDDEEHENKRPRTFGVGCSPTSAEAEPALFEYEDTVPDSTLQSPVSTIGSATSALSCTESMLDQDECRYELEPYQDILGVSIEPLNPALHDVYLPRQRTNFGREKQPYEDILAISIEPMKAPECHFSTTNIDPESNTQHYWTFVV